MVLCLHPGPPQDDVDVGQLRLEVLVLHVGADHAADLTQLGVDLP